MKNLLLSAVLFLCCSVANAQFVFSSKNLPDEVSILETSSIANVGHAKFSFDDIKSGKVKPDFKSVKGRLGNLGFTKDTYWVKFSLENKLAEPVKYYLETAEPVTDNVDLYLVSSTGRTYLQRSGDNLAFSNRAVADRKSVFDISLDKGETVQAFMEVKNDGEKNNLPLKLIKPSKLLERTYHDQLIMGIFFGILAVIAITYLFFYFALKETSFLHYSLYVMFMALCQFALDGFFHQYFGTGDSWISRHTVIISAILSCYFFGRYSVTVLDIKNQNNILHRSYQALFIALTVLLAAVLFIPPFLEYAYPIINILTIIGILLIFATVVTKFVRKQEIDMYYVGGIVILFLCIALAVSMNFGVFPDDFATDNITKPGIALEIIALSLSMANRIKLLKTKKEELQAVALQKSEEMNDIKSYFLSNMSHELRTPLNAILGLVSSMETETDAEKIKANCDTIRYASHGLISSVNDILDFSRIEKGELRLDHSEFKIQEIFEKLRGTVRKQIDDKGLTFNFTSDVDPGISVFGDATRLEQMLYNLLGNACKFTAEGEVGFRIDAKVTEKKLGLRISISDTGVGIAKEKLESVFGLFSQSRLDNKRKFGGFGIGLSIVKSLVDLHQGTISLESELDKGTVCTVNLEYEIAAIAAKPVEVAPAEKSYAGKNVLIVEDNAMNQMVIKMMLKGLPGLTFAVANDGSECLEKMSQERFDLVLMDLQMPVMDGYEATEAIRAGKTGDSNTNVPIIVITADTTLESKDRVFQLGVNDYTTKPIDKKTLYAKMDAVFFGEKPVVEEKLEPVVKNYSEKNFLIVEDNVMNQMVIKMMLKSLGVQFQVAADGAECLELMKQQTFDLVLMDLQMPVMDGYEATEAIRAGETGTENSKIPIVVVTADTTLESKDRVFELGVDDYLTKPIDKKLLYSKIDKIIFGEVPQIELVTRLQETA
ncbi:MAG: hybrid sensor histidine kinase/response regulator [Flavobacterium sp.]|uniref:hybrid sensor histidine kinase/response regulator n=1 Tax=Flavobacterium sp. TaxID=239 RepID=UPI00122A32A2|nr:hybrid sensor histidine kinase/response regulator [Flavobacterium sp.]RZJ67831.1 MAG: hybrid sensor histidine kinase/response regulator [Flavobacterium sp.]